MFANEPYKYVFSLLLPIPYLITEEVIGYLFGGYYSSQIFPFLGLY